MSKTWLEEMDKPVVELFPVKALSWTATCPNCGEVEIVARHKPTTCKNILKLGKRSHRLCRNTLTNVCQP